MAQRVLLKGSGPFVSPAVLEFLGLTLVSEKGKATVRLSMQDGRELQIPIHAMAYRKLCRKFHEQYLRMTEEEEDEDDARPDRTVT